MRRARDIKEQLVELCKRVEIDYENEELSDSSDPENTNILKALCSGFFYNTAKRQKSGAYKTVKTNQQVHIHPNSALFEVLPKWVVYHEYVLTSKEFIRNVI